MFLQCFVPENVGCVLQGSIMIFSRKFLKILMMMCSVSWNNCDVFYKKNSGKQTIEASRNTFLEVFLYSLQALCLIFAEHLQLAVIVELLSQLKDIHNSVRSLLL